MYRALLVELSNRINERQDQFSKSVNDPSLTLDDTRKLFCFSQLFEFADDSSFELK